ncbi:MAG: bifunctional ADP-dependent NAD(P)H-hydrate dehydratase/NAD(P)H-hydrate epimerase, partial [Chromatiales bacterium]|nr:bifunctional ADP-dependent NAD(P)H-hydrate dehydratase/NAD(P)H-hydrate epimerase [Chromatiales bacterium]
MVNIDKRVYTPAMVREMDRTAIEDAGIEGYTLMCRAGTAACADIADRFPRARRWLVACGAGNNGGDGYVVARLAHAAGIEVTTVALTDPQQLRGDAQRAWHDFQVAGGHAVPFDPGLLATADLIVDGLLGTGIDRPVSGAYRDAIEAIGRASLPVVAIDVPSGLNAETGAVMGSAVSAELTVTFVGLKQGFYLGAGPDHVGVIRFHDLEIPFAAVAGIEPSLRRFKADDLAALLPPRHATDHKGCFGHVLIIGGNRGMVGAARLAGEAALRSGAGLVSVAVHPDGVALVAAGRAELMVTGVSSATGRDSSGLDQLIERASVIAVGPGLGQDDWSRGLLERIISTPQPKVLDADALNLLAGTATHRDEWILTPHPGEAAVLLGCATADVQADRPGALRELNSRYGGVSILKGHGSLIAAAGELPFLIDHGNPGMATAGMGDVLT